ncbi:MAG: TetR/AcrR family transcriptional regulator [Propionibacteriaceae bacterium]|nr:TetR/AcrR family transcriptional regulator [Propionibacteriaceae bacterium]
MPRIAQPLDAGRRQQLHAVAAEEFLTHGYERASLNRIIDRAGIAKSSFYYYFEDKRALHADLVAHLERTVREALHLPRIERLTADGFWSAAEGLVADLARVLERTPELATVARVLYGAGPEGASPELARLMADARGWVARALTRGQELGVVRRDLPPELLARLAMAVFVELDRWALENFEDPRTGRAADTAVQMLFATIRGGNP